MSAQTKELVDRYKSFKDGLSKEDTWDIWISISGRPEVGICQINEKARKFSFRVYDDTPSVSPMNNLNVYDFGNGERYDPVKRIMDITGTDFINAVAMFMSWIGEDVKLDIQQFKRNKEKKSEPAPYKPSYIRRVISDRKKYQNDYDVLAKGLFRGCTEKEKKYAESVLYIGYIPKSEDYEDRIFIPEMDNDGVPYGSFRYNRNADPKGLLRKYSRRVLFGSHMLPKYRETIVYSEGHSDTVVNIAKRIACITTGSATKKFDGKLEILKGKTLYDFPDLDIAGLKGAMNRIHEIKEFNKGKSTEDKIKHIIFWWSDWIKSKKYFEKIQNNKIEKSDELFLIANKIPLKNGFAAINKDLIEIIQRDICKKNKWNFEDYSIKNWKIIFKNQAKNQGYDFIDFYQDNSSKEKDLLLNLLNRKAKF